MRDNLLAGKILHVKYDDNRNSGKDSYDVLFIFTDVNNFDEDTNVKSTDLEVFTTDDGCITPSSVFYPHDEYARYFGFFFNSHNVERLSYRVIPYAKEVNVQYEIGSGISVVTELKAYHRGWYRVDGEQLHKLAQESWLNNNLHLL